MLVYNRYMAKQNSKPKSDVDKINISPTETKLTHKQIVKGLNLNFPLVEEQKKVPESFYKYDFTFVHGDAGSGKTLSAVHTALTYLGKGECKEIWITRPMLKNNLAALPGTLEEKMYPYTFPIIQNIEACVGKETCDKLLEAQIIRIMPIEVAKGCTFMDSAVIVDEYQDMDYEDFRTILSRLGDKSKMILCGSKQQISKLIRQDSAIYRTLCLENEPTVGYITLKSNHRAKSLEKLLPMLDQSHDEICDKQVKAKAELNATLSGKKILRD